MEQSPGRLAEHLYTAPPWNQDQNDDESHDVDDVDDVEDINDDSTLCTPGCRVSASGAPTSSLQSKCFIIKSNFS